MREFKEYLCGHFDANPGPVRTVVRARAGRPVVEVSPNMAATRSASSSGRGSTRNQSGACLADCSSAHATRRSTIDSAAAPCTHLMPGSASSWSAS